MRITSSLTSWSWGKLCVAATGHVFGADGVLPWFLTLLTARWEVLESFFMLINTTTGLAHLYELQTGPRPKNSKRKYRNKNADVIDRILRAILAVSKRGKRGIHDRNRILRLPFPDVTSNKFEGGYGCPTPRFVASFGDLSPPGRYEL